MLYNDNSTPENLDDDFIVKAAPMAGSEYSDFVETPLTFNFTVEEFAKAEVPVEVICFDEADYESFGFNWFAMTEITVREQVFFGDICVTDLAAYEGSAYEGQVNGLQLDMPAIFKVDVYKNDAFIKSYSNEGWLGEGSPLEVQYPDHDNASDEFEFKLYILVEDAGEFVYTYFHSWFFADDEMIEAGDDGVVDFVLGTCNYSETDLQLSWPSNPTFVEGYDEEKEKLAGVRFRNFDSSNDNEEIYIGLHDLGTGSNREALHVKWAESNDVTFTYNPNTGILYTQVVNVNGTYTVSKNVGDLGDDLDYMNLSLVDREGDNGDVELNDVILDGMELGSFAKKGWNDWQLHYDLSSGFEMTATIKLTGTFKSSSENSKIQIMVGHPA